MKTKIILSILIASLLGACETFVTGINEDDITRAQDADLKQALIAAEVTYMGSLEGNMARICNLWTGYLYGVSLQAGGYYNYGMIASTYNTMWDNVYALVLKNLRVTQVKAATLNNRSILGISQVMEASLVGSAAALWGDVPFSEASNAEEFPNPRYELQIQVIDKLITLLDTALVNLSSLNGGLRTGDFLDTSLPNDRWIAVAYSVKSRLLLYRKDYAGALAAANLGIQSPSNDLTGKHGTGNGERNQYYEFLVLSAWTGTITASNTFLGKMLNSTEPGNRNHAKTNESARLARYYSGTTVAAYTPNTSASGYFGQSAPFPLHTANETKLIAAECLVQTGDFPNALAKLNEHRSNLRAVYPTGTYTDFVAPDFDPGNIENVAGTLTPLEALLREIREEKFVCLYGQVETYTELRRTNNSLGLPPNTGSEIPHRFLYAQTEINANVNTPNPIPGMFERTAIFQ